MLSFNTNRRTAIFVPLVNNCVIDDGLLVTRMPYTYQSLLQFIDIMNFSLVVSLLHFYENFVVKRVQI